MGDLRLEEVEKQRPLSIILGIVFDTKTKKILISKRKNKSQITELTWCFPGGKIEVGEDLEKEIKRKIKEKTGLEIESLGSVFAETNLGNEGLLSIYYLCEFLGGNENPSEEYEEFKWVSPGKIEDYFGKELHPHLKEYLINLK